MSYILDALSKADARRQDAVPDLYARSAGGHPEHTRRPAGWHPAWLWLAAAALIAGSVWALWRMLLVTTKPAAVVAQAAPLAKATPSVALVAQAPVAAPAPTPAAAPVPVRTAASVPMATASATPRAATPPPAKVATVAPTRNPDKPLSAAPAASQTLVTAPKPATPVAAALPTYAKLEASVRSQIPPLAVGGSVYSPQASARLLMLNGQVLHEGDRISDGLTVESIGPKASTLNWRGTRFQLPH
jgi:general secretion pathway protein B